MPAPARGFTFTLIIEGPVDDPAVIDALFDAGCDDATFGIVDGVGFGDFRRVARSFLGAASTAIRQVDSVPGVQVVRIGSEDLVTMAEIARRLSRSRESVRLLAADARGPGGFPPPVARIRSRSPLWRWVDVATWAEGALGHADPDAGLIASINAALEIRRRRSDLGALERRFVDALAG
ncbi:MAG: helix-turn-helix transcriptional regulator [Actinomycetota bacterium]